MSCGRESPAISVLSMRLCPICVTCTLLVVAASSPSTAGAPLLELQVADQTYVGKSLAHNQHVCWLAQPDGLYAEVPLANVTSFRKLNEDFEPLTTVETRNRLRRELGHGWEIAGTKHYLVCARGPQERAYAEVFERLYGNFRQYFRTRGFSLAAPEFPLVAIVFPDVVDFAEYCRMDDLRFVPGLRGYYRRTTNRIVLFDPGETWLSSEVPHDRPTTLTRSFVDFNGEVQGPRWLWRDAQVAVRPVAYASLESSLAETLIHEGTHQIAFNLGLHSRIGETPKWVVEGLATMFEAEGARQNLRASAPSSRVNPERLNWFRDYARRRRPGGSLAQFVVDDHAFMTATLDAYSQAWALTFFLAETRSSKYAAYLRRIAERDPLTPYGAEERLQDFQQAFGTDVSRLEVAFLRFITDLD